MQTLIISIVTAWMMLVAGLIGYVARHRGPRWPR